jgi:hypothetical protein
MAEQKKDFSHPDFFARNIEILIWQRENETREKKSTYWESLTNCNQNEGNKSREKQLNPI